MLEGIRLESSIYESRNKQSVNEKGYRVNDAKGSYKIYTNLAIQIDINLDGIIFRTECRCIFYDYRMVQLHKWQIKIPEQ